MPLRWPVCSWLRTGPKAVQYASDYKAGNAGDQSDLTALLVLPSPMDDDVIAEGH